MAGRYPFNMYSTSSHEHDFDMNDLQLNVTLPDESRLMSTELQGSSNTVHYEEKTSDAYVPSIECFPHYEYQYYFSNNSISNTNLKIVPETYNYSDLYNFSDPYYCTNHVQNTSCIYGSKFGENRQWHNNINIFPSRGVHSSVNSENFNLEIPSERENKQNMVFNNQLYRSTDECTFPKKYEVPLAPISPYSGSGFSTCNENDLISDCNSVTSSLDIVLENTISSLSFPLKEIYDDNNVSRVDKNVLKELGLPIDTPIEYVNGGFGFKNPIPQCSSERKPAASTVYSEGNIVFICQVCDKTFKLERTLNRHFKCHSQYKKYLCTLCVKGFNDKFDLKRHSRTHRGIRPYKCNICEKAFAQRVTLETHCLTIHKIKHDYTFKEKRSKMYVCEECGNSTGDVFMYVTHLNEKHPYSHALKRMCDKRSFNFKDFAEMM